MCMYMSNPNPNPKPGIPLSSEDRTIYTPGIGTHFSYGLISPEEDSGHFLQREPITMMQLFFISPDNH